MIGLRLDESIWLKLANYSHEEHFLFAIDEVFTNLIYMLLSIQWSYLQLVSHALLFSVQFLLDL